MTQDAADGWDHQDIDLGCGVVSYRVKGSGPPLLHLPRDNGYPPTLDFLDSLAKEYTVYAPWLPGFTNGAATDWTWLRDGGDAALVLGAAVKRLGLSDAVLLGFGFGGWVAAEMLCANPAPFVRAVLVAPMGVRPASGVIYDQFLVNAETYARRMFHDQARFEQVFGELPSLDQLVAWEDDREMACRLGWKPYMHNPSLERLLRFVATPVTLVHGTDDEVVPLEASQLFCNALPSASLIEVPGCGHAAELEQPAHIRQAIG